MALADDQAMRVREAMIAEPRSLSAGDTARVAARLLEVSPGDPLTRIVSDVAERLVREEIARMRAAVQAKQTVTD